jgi:hypothetical protein
MKHFRAEALLSVQHQALMASAPRADRAARKFEDAMCGVPHRVLFAAPGRGRRPKRSVKVSVAK